MYYYGGYQGYGCGNPCCGGQGGGYGYGTGYGSYHSSFIYLISYHHRSTFFWCKLAKKTQTCLF